MKNETGESKAGSITSWVLLALLLVCASGVVLRVATSAGPIRSDLEEMGAVTIEPRVTRWALSPYFSIPVYVWMIVGIIKELLVKSPVTRLVLNGVLLGCLVLYGCMYEYAFYVPMVVTFRF